MLNEDKLKFNISRKAARIEKYEKGIDVLRNSDNPHDPFTKGRIDYLSSLIEDDKEAISNWQRLLDSLPVEPTR